ncbi:hypothetical protein PMIN06_012008 [Paraphaeosphaeria minitans]
MVAVPFGFSIGDFIAGTKLLIDVFGAFKETSGASSKYASDTTFLHSLTSTLQHLDDYVKPNPQNALSSSISSLLDTVRGPLDDFKTFLDKYEASLGKVSTKSKLGKVPKTVTYTLKDISGKIAKLRQQVEQPLLHFSRCNKCRMLSISAHDAHKSDQFSKTIEELPDQPLRPEQCAQIVEATKVADIPTELDKQIQVLQRSASEHNIGQDEQLQRIKDMRAKLDGGLANLTLSLEKVEDVTTTDVATRAGQQAQLGASKDMQSSLSQLSAALETGTTEIKKSVKVHRDLVFVFKTFLEEKVAINERATAKADAPSRASSDKVESSPWPPATLPAAHMAITLLSTVVSSITAVSVIKQSRKPTPMSSSTAPDIPRTISSSRQSLKGRKPTPISFSKAPEVPRGIRSATLNRTIVKGEVPHEPPSQSSAKTWVSDFSSSTAYGRTSSMRRDTSSPKPSTPKPSTPKPSTSKSTRTNSLSTHNSLWGYGNDTEWSKKMSKLDETDSHSGRKNNHQRPDHHPDSNDHKYLESPGPVIPSLNKGLHAGWGHGRHSHRDHEGHHSRYSGGHAGGQSGQYCGGYVGGDYGTGGASGTYSGGYIAGGSGSGGGASGTYSGGYIGKPSESSDGSWPCQTCYSVNSDLTPDFCPLCGSTRYDS